MSAVWKKIVADLFHRRWITFLVTCTVIVSAALLTLALSTLLNLSGPYDKLFDELNSAHLWLHFKPYRVSSMDIRRIEALPGVVDSTDVQYSYFSQVTISNETRAWVDLRVIPLEPPNVHSLKVIAGRYLLPGKDEILIEKYAADTYHVAVGDMIEVTREDNTKAALPVIGIAYDPMYDTYRSNQLPSLFVSQDTFRSQFPDQDTWVWSVGLRLADPEAVDEVLDEIESMRSSEFVDTHTDWRDAKESAVFSVQLTFAFLSAFSIFAIFATILIVVSVVSSMVLSQIRQIGILKAIGFTGNQVSLLYVGQYAIISLVGAGLGFILGLILAPLPLQTITASLGTTYYPPFSFLLMGLVFLIIPGTNILAAWAAARRGAKANVIRSIATGAESPLQKPFWGTRFIEYLGAPMTIVMGFNDTFAKPIRAILTGLNLTLGVIGIVFGLTLSGTLQTYRENPALLGIVYDAFVTRQDSSDGRAQRILSQAPGVQAFYGEYRLRVKTLDGEEFLLRAVEGELSAFPFYIPEGRFFYLDTNEAIVGRGLLDWLDLEIGDSLTLTLAENDRRTETWTIVGVYPEPADAGQRMIVPLSSVLALDRHAASESYYLKVDQNVDLLKLRKYIEPDKDTDLTLTLVEEAIPSSVIFLQLAIFMLGGILVAIAVVNVFIMSLLSTQEKIRVVGILKTIGMIPFQVVVMIITSAGVLGMLAVLIGIPAGLLLTRVLLTTLSNAFGFGLVSVSVNVLVIIFLIPIIISISLLGSLIPARWASRISIVRVLRQE
ncbi:MAG: ABC transporter permease [Anaerolineales bacterium]|nr:ABC transporter permease [Anaerolineales bacterium]